MCIVLDHRDRHGSGHQTHALDAPPSRRREQVIDHLQSNTISERVRNSDDLDGRAIRALELAKEEGKRSRGVYRRVDLCRIEQSTDYSNVYVAWPEEPNDVAEGGELRNAIF